MMALDTAAEPLQDRWQSQHSATLPDWHIHHYGGQTLRHTHDGGRLEHGYYGHAEDRQSGAHVRHRRSELEFRRRVWQEAGTAMDQAARLLVVALVKTWAPNLTEITLTGEYGDDGELHLNLTGARQDAIEVDEDALIRLVSNLDADNWLSDALLDMVAGTGEDYLGTNTIDITEEGKYA